MRLRSLDVFRGLTMAGMVIVNNPGDWATVFPPLLHAEWHGWTPTDLIFPWFLFVMGAAIAQTDGRRSTPLAMLRRGATLVGLGLFMSGFPFFDLSHWRIPGVLFRLGLCAATAGLIWRGLVTADLMRSAARTVVAAVGALLAYWALIAWVAPPGGAAGDLSPEGNLGAWIDRAVFGTHLWKTTWDPEGLLSSLPAVGTTLFGVAAGAWVRARRSHCVAPTLVWAGVAAIVGGLMWDTVFPINKSLWTSSYALFTAGTAAVMLGLLTRRLDDGRSSPRLDALSEPWVALGRNALLLFVVSGLVAKTLLLWKVGGGMSAQQWIYQHAFAPLAAPRVASLAYALTNLAALFALLAWLHRRQWYWRV